MGRLNKPRNGAPSMSMIPSEAILRVLVSGVMVDNKRIPRKWYNKVAPLLVEFNRWNDTLSEFDTSKPQTWVKTGMRLTSMLIEQEHPSRIDPVDRFLSDSDCESAAPDCVEFVLSDIFSHMKMESVLQTSARTVYRVDLDKDAGIFFMVVRDNPPVAGPSDEADEDYDPEYIGDVYLQNDDEKAMKALSILGDRFWENGHTMIFVDKADDQILGKDHKLSGRVYKGETLDVLTSMKKFEDQSIRRVIVLQGSPGTGKSTLCENIAEMLNDRVMVMSNSILTNIDREGWFTLMDMMKPKLVIIDDIDRVGPSRLESSLYLFEDNNYQVPLTLLTTNDKDKLPLAFRRPGRIDMVFEMPLPGQDIRRKIVVEFAKTMGIESVPDSHMDFLMSIMDDFPGAYIKELMLRYRAYGFDYKIPTNDMVFGQLQARLDAMSVKKEDEETVEKKRTVSLAGGAKMSIGHGTKLFLNPGGSEIFMKKLNEMSIPMDYQDDDDDLDEDDLDED